MFSRVQEIIDYKHVFVCSRCSHIGNNDLQEDEPACEDLPRGVKALSSGTTVSSFNLERGFFRISAESQSVLECYNEDACLGGGTVGEYCAPGYQGPCKCVASAGLRLRLGQQVRQSASLNASQTSRIFSRKKGNRNSGLWVAVVWC